VIAYQGAEKTDLEKGEGEDHGRHRHGGCTIGMKCMEERGEEGIKWGGGGESRTTSLSRLQGVFVKGKKRGRLQATRTSLSERKKKVAYDLKKGGGRG